MINRSGWIMRSACFGAVLCVLGALSPCDSSTFSIAPIRVELAGSQATEVLTVRNENDTPIILQARAMAWTQDDGVDFFADTREVIVAPPVLTINPHSSQIVRVALRRPADVSRELSYRLFLQEVPQPVLRVNQGLTVALRMSLPIFIAPEKAEPVPQIQWRGQWRGDGSIELTALNDGRVHLQLFNIRLDFDGSGHEVDVLPSRYVLPGTQGRWLVTAPASTDRPASIRVHGESDRGKFSADVVLPST
jgi:fimbrial chaperone protein